jgi:hypothetical protein
MKIGARRRGEDHFWSGICGTRGEANEQDDRLLEMGWKENWGR